MHPLMSISRRSVCGSLQSSTRGLTFHAVSFCLLPQKKHRLIIITTQQILYNVRKRHSMNNIVLIVAYADFNNCILARVARTSPSLTLDTVAPKTAAST